jgi:AcrR family transcriptional regulator
MALPRFAKLPAERRHRLIAAAAVELAAKGYDGAVLGAIAARSGMKKTSVYYYFADKADLCATVLEEAWRLLSAAARIDLATLTAETFWSSVETVSRENRELCSREPWLFAASKLLNRASLNPAGVTVLDEYSGKRRAWEEAFIRRGQELGVVRDDVPAELLATTSLSARQAFNLWLLDRMEELSPEKVGRLTLHAFEIFRALLSPPLTLTRHRAGEAIEGARGSTQARSAPTA